MKEYCAISLDEWIQYEPESDDATPIQLWGQDHWSTFAYLETRIVDHDGVVDNRKMRCAPRLHREFAHFMYEGELADGSKYPTRLKSGEIENHDDWSCLEDMVVLGLIKAFWHVKYPDRAFGNSEAQVELTAKGKIAA
jgi:hypothetical protein